MDETAQLSELIGDIYDASLDAGLWPSVVEGLAGFLPGAFVNVFSQDATRKTAQAFYTWGIEPKFLEMYFQKYIHLNPMFPATLFFEVGRILTEEDIMPRAEFSETRFFKEWVRPQGLLSSSMASILDKSATSVAGIAIWRRGVGLLDGELKPRLHILAEKGRRPGDRKDGADAQLVRRAGGCASSRRRPADRHVRSDSHYIHPSQVFDCLSS